MKKLLLFICLLCPLGLIYATNNCADLIGIWDGDKHASTSATRQTRVVFTHMERDGSFKGYYIFMDTPQTSIHFFGKCSITDLGFEQLSFKPVPPKFNVCIGAYNAQKELWLGCPFIKVDGVYRKNIT
jgi:hypothetical protein